jgi:hypothetical protein
MAIDLRSSGSSGGYANGWRALSSILELTRSEVIYHELCGVQKGDTVWVVWLQQLGFQITQTLLTSSDE